MPGARWQIALRGDIAVCAVHHDRDSRLQSCRVLLTLERHGLVGPVDRVGASGTNAPMASFFALTQTIVRNHRSWTRRTELRSATATWIERKHRGQRNHSLRGRLTLIAFKTVMNTNTDTVARLYLSFERASARGSTQKMAVLTPVF